MIKNIVPDAAPPGEGFCIFYPPHFLKQKLIYMQVGSIVVFVGNLEEANNEAKAVGKPLIVKDHPYEVTYIGKFSPAQRLKMAMVRWNVLFDDYIIVDLYPGVALNPEDWREVLPPDPMTVEDIIQKENWEHDQGKLIQEQALNNPI